jgi:hypothetical protein
MPDAPKSCAILTGDEVKASAIALVGEPTLIEPEPVHDARRAAAALAILGAIADPSHLVRVRDMLDLMLAEHDREAEVASVLGAQACEEAAS